MTPASWAGSEGGSVESVPPPRTSGYRAHRPGDGFFCWCATGERPFKFFDPIAGEAAFVKVRVSVDPWHDERGKAYKYRCLVCFRAGKPDWHKPTLA